MSIPCGIFPLAIHEFPEDIFTKEQRKRGVFITEGDVGVGTIVGSAVFNILVIIGVCGIFARQTVTLTWWSMFRDSLYYIFSVLALILVIYDEQVVWWESMLLISMYGVYILIMKALGPDSYGIAARSGVGLCHVTGCMGDGTREAALKFTLTPAGEWVPLDSGEPAAEQNGTENPPSPHPGKGAMRASSPEELSSSPPGRSETETQTVG
ncbi:Sodium/potassium/calcium exchanger 4 [Anabarilius grahami]|uniref:Sodium/potassium/calcium exchanger 4 n=1 Tax=Anabarilius grahami TaxID=495550 RepID=A0A3N0Y7X1_ANAGA|nr:Sodium/potassium/calcium exchanger 4 [Anabarilius grahami]